LEEEESLEVVEKQKIIVKNLPICRTPTKLLSGELEYRGVLWSM